MSRESQDSFEKERIDRVLERGINLHVVKESHLRSAIKGFTWRIIATTTTIIIAYVITGEIGTALSIGMIEFVGKIIIYYLHERIWQAIPRGGVRKFFRFNK